MNPGTYKADETYELAVIGGGPAGLAAALAAYEAGLRDILIIERDSELGGILNQCIHTGFGLHHFHEDLTGPEYAGRFIRMLRETGVRVCLDTMALEFAEAPASGCAGAFAEMQGTYALHVVSRRDGYRILRAKSVVLAMGCRERTRGAIGIPGTRPAGILTAGAAQRYVNIEGYMVGKRILILGSGDIGLIMARRLTLEGANVLACVELMPYSSGLTRNIVQCLHDFDIPLYLSHTVTDILGSRRVEGATVSRVDENQKPISGTEMNFDCDTILLSVGLIPENELSRQAGLEIDPHTRGAVVYEDRETSLPGVFACGNVLHVHDLVDFVTEESVLAGKAAAAYVKGAPAEQTLTDRTYTDSTHTDSTVVNGASAERTLALESVGCVAYTVPQRLRLSHMKEQTDIFFRVDRVCKESAVVLRLGETIVARYRRERLAPGEMEKLTLPRKLLARFLQDGGEADRLTLSVEEVVATEGRSISAGNAAAESSSLSVEEVGR